MDQFIGTSAQPQDFGNLTTSPVVMASGSYICRTLEVTHSSNNFGAGDDSAGSGLSAAVSRLGEGEKMLCFSTPSSDNDSTHVDSPGCRRAMIALMPSQACVKTLWMLVLRRNTTNLKTVTT